MYLGEIIVPRDDPEWVPKMTYRAEPPIVVRGALDPYNAERKRAVWIAEEAAWKKILPLQARYNELRRQEALIMQEIQHWIRDLERLTGKKSGMADAANYASILYSISGGPYAWAAMIGKLGIDFILGIGKKKQAKSIMQKLEALGVRMEAVQKELAAVVAQIEPLTYTGAALKAEQQAIMAADYARADDAYKVRQLTEGFAAKAHESRALLYERLKPTSRQAANNVL